jgi:hypothetical protein
MPTNPTRRLIGQRLEALQLETLSHGTLRLPGAGLTHLQFRRFSGCPICNLHLRTFAQSYESLRSAKVQVVAFFHSSAKSMRPHQGSLPFPTVPDPERKFYRLFGVERSVMAVLNPKAAWAMIRGLASPSANPLAGGPDPNGLPADFLIDDSGLIVDLKYGKHADDHWSVEDVLARAHQ